MKKYNFQIVAVTSAQITLIGPCAASQCPTPCQCYCNGEIPPPAPVQPANCVCPHYMCPQCECAILAA